MAKEKIAVKSTLGFGNLPIYSGSGIHTDSGCLFVIQSRILYEFGRVQLKFSTQSAPNLLHLSGDLPILEMDPANLIRLITLLKTRHTDAITSGSREFLLVGSSTMSEYASFQKPAYIRIDEKDIVVFNLMHQGQQSLFEVKGSYQIETLIVFLEQLQKTLITSTMNFDFYKNHGIGSMLTAPAAMINQSQLDIPK